MRPKRYAERGEITLRVEPNDTPFVGPPLKSFGVYNPSYSIIYYEGEFYNSLMLRPSHAVFGVVAWELNPKKRIRRRTIRTRPQHDDD